MGEELKVLASLQIGAAMQELAGNNVSPEPVHKARTYIKKARAVIQLAAPGLGGLRRREVTALLRDASLRLAPIRDSEVQVRMLDTALETEEMQPEDFVQIRAGLADIAKQSRINGVRQIPRVLASLSEAVSSIPGWPLEPLGPKEIRRRVRRIYRRGRSTLDLCRVSQDQDTFHLFRKQIKQLWYALRITCRFWPADGEPLIGELELLGELAGRERDLSLLLMTLRHGPRNRGSLALIPALETRLPELKLAVLTGAGRFYEERPKVFAEKMRI